MSARSGSYRGKGGWLARAIVLLALWLAPPTLFETGRYTFGFGEPEPLALQVDLSPNSSSSGSDGELPLLATTEVGQPTHVLSGYTVAWLSCVGALVVPFVLYRAALRSAYETSRTRNEPRELFFGSWAYAEGSVLIFAYIALHLSVVVACARRLARFFAVAEGWGLGLSIACATRDMGLALRFGKLLVRQGRFNEMSPRSCSSVRLRITSWPWSLG